MVCFLFGFVGHGHVLIIVSFILLILLLYAYIVCVKDNKDDKSRVFHCIVHSMWFFILLLHSMPDAMYANGVQCTMSVHRAHWEGNKKCKQKFNIIFTSKWLPMGTHGPWLLMVGWCSVQLVFIVVQFVVLLINVCVNAIVFS